MDRKRRGCPTARQGRKLVEVLGPQEISLPVGGRAELHEILTEIISETLLTADLNRLLAFPVNVQQVPPPHIRVPKVCETSGPDSLIPRLL